MSLWFKTALVYACCPVISINGIPLSYQHVLGWTLSDINILALLIMTGTILVPRSSDYSDSDGDFKVFFSPYV